MLVQVRADGLPEPTYNETLDAFDAAVIRGLDADGAGLTVIVETFAGNRVYYAYVSTGDHPRSVVERLREEFPEHTIQFRGRPDPQWSMYADYKARFAW